MMQEATMQDQPARTVGALFIGPDGKVLLGLRAPSKKVWPQHWDTIGGHVEDGESLEDALIREAREEVGVTPTRFRLIATVKERKPEIYGDALHHVYAVTAWRPRKHLRRTHRTEMVQCQGNAAADEHRRFRLSPLCSAGDDEQGQLGPRKRRRPRSNL
jgi:8-oxo-dGTP pyrophosphatase MutT (NUDIX family)